MLPAKSAYKRCGEFKIISRHMIAGRRRVIPDQTGYFHKTCLCKYYKQNSLTQENNAFEVT